MAKSKSVQRAKAASAVRRRPENKQALGRMLELLQLLPQKRPGKTALRLHQELEDSGYAMTLRSVQRDLITLSVPFAITCDEDDTPQRTQHWYWIPNATRDFAAITQTESIALLMVEQFLTSMAHKSLLLPLQRRLDAARNFINATNGNTARTPWTFKFLSAPREYALLAPEFDPDVLREILDALFSERQIEILYQSLNDVSNGKAPWIRTLHPHALLFKGSVAYLVAREDGAAAGPVKQYAVHRIREIKATTKSSAREGFNFTEYRDLELHELGAGDEITLKLALRHATVQKVLSEARLAEDQKIFDQHGTTIVEAVVRDTNPLRRWLLAQGDRIEVLEPPDLRAYMRSQLESATKYYGDPAR
jgi:predicted DNA-binding transcriptional regulator YafY